MQSSAQFQVVLTNRNHQVGLWWNSNQQKSSAGLFNSNNNNNNQAFLLRFEVLRLDINPASFSRIYTPRGFNRIHSLICTFKTLFLTVNTASLPVTSFCHSCVNLEKKKLKVQVKIIRDHKSSLKIHIVISYVLFSFLLPLLNNK